MQETRNMLIVADGHLHWYPGYNMGSAFESLTLALDAIARETNPSKLPVLNLGFLVEGAAFDFFAQLRSGSIDHSALDAEIHASEDGLSLMFMRRGVCRLCLVAGRQIVTAERLEVLGIGLNRHPGDGESITDTIRHVSDLGGFPILPWSPGKWLFRRGAIVKRVIEQAGRTELAIGDSSLRPGCLPDPALIRSARSKGLALVPGSDPLPIPREEKVMGSYGFVYEGPFDVDRPALSVLRILTEEPERIRPAGARSGLARTVRRLMLLKIQKRESSRGTDGFTGGA